MRVDLVDSSPCKIEPVGAMIFGKWTSHLLWSLAHYGPLRFGELCASTPGATPKVLTARLRQLQRDGLVARRLYREAPPRSEYHITDLGRSLIPVFQSLAMWVDENIAEVEFAREQFDSQFARVGSPS